MIRLFLMSILLAAGPLSLAQGLDGSSQMVDVSLTQLLATPEKYDGKVVRVQGFISLEFEAVAVYLHRDDYEYLLFRNAVWIDVPEKLIRGRKPKLDQRYGSIIGTFRANQHGHKGMFSGAITDISDIDPRLSRSEYSRLQRAQ